MSDRKSRFRDLIGGYVSRDGDVDDLGFWSEEDLKALASMCRAEVKERQQQSSAGAPTNE